MYIYTVKNVKCMHKTFLAIPTPNPVLKVQPIEKNCMF